MVTVGVVREPVAEHRVALTPDGVSRLGAAGLATIVEPGAGARAWFTDDDYVAAGARIAPRSELIETADVVVCIGPPPDADRLPAGRALVGLLRPLVDPDLACRLAEAKITAISLDRLPRTLSRAQAMDVLTSQANVAGYKAALVAADAYCGYFPMLITAAGTVPPAQVLVCGAGVAGLQAIATARRLGAVVTGYDVRDAARAEVLATGAEFLELSTDVSAVGAGGYARELTDDERRALQEAMNAAVARFDVVITTAQVPGRRPPELVSAEALARMRPGSVAVDLAAGALGGNVAGSVPSTATVTGHGVTVIGAENLPSAAPRAASTAYARNLVALLGVLVRDGALTIDLADNIQAGVVTTHDGSVLDPAVRDALGLGADADADADDPDSAPDDEQDAP